MNAAGGKEDVTSVVSFLINVFSRVVDNATKTKTDLSLNGFAGMQHGHGAILSRGAEGLVEDLTLKQLSE